MSKYYSREITMPKDKKEGLANFVQIIINALEDGNPQEALLLAVDLRQDVDSGIYEAVVTSNVVEAVRRELDAKHAAQLVKEHDDAFRAGQDQARREIAKRLGLAA